MAHGTKGLMQDTDAGHLNAVKGMALTYKIPLQGFLAKMLSFKIFAEEKRV